MDYSTVQSLVAAVQKRPFLGWVDGGELSDFLKDVPVPSSSRFHHPLPPNEYRHVEGGLTLSFSLRRVLLNNQVANYARAWWKKVADAAAEALGVYSSTAMARELRMDPEIVEILGASGGEVSLLGRFVDEDLERERPRRIYRPVLVVPGISEGGLERMDRWEEAHTVQKDERWVAGLVHGISPRAYPKD